MKKRVFSLFTVLVLCLSLFPMQAVAEEPCDHTALQWFLNGPIQDGTCTYAYRCTCGTNVRKTITLTCQSDQSSLYYGQDIPELFVKDVQSDDPSDAITYEWYDKVDSNNIPTGDPLPNTGTSLQIEDTLSPGSYTYTCAITVSGVTAPLYIPFHLIIKPKNICIDVKTVNYAKAGDTVSVSANVYDDDTPPQLIDSPPQVNLSYKIDGVSTPISNNSFTIPNDTNPGTRITITAELDGSEKDNYNLAVNPAFSSHPTLTVTEKTPVIISGIEKADNLYDGNPHAGYTGTISAQVVGGDTFSDLQLVYKDKTADPSAPGTSDPPTNAGTYDLYFQSTDSNYEVVGYLDENNQIVEGPLTFNIEQAPGPVLTLTPSTTTANKGDTVTIDLSPKDYEAEVTCETSAGVAKDLTPLGNGEWSIVLDEEAPATYTFEATYQEDDNHATSTATCAVFVSNQPKEVKLPYSGDLYLSDEAENANILQLNVNGTITSSSSIRYENSQTSGTVSPRQLTLNGSSGSKLEINSIDGATNHESLIIQGGLEVYARTGVSVGGSGGVGASIQVTGGSTLKVNDRLLCSQLAISENSTVKLEHEKGGLWIPFELVPGKLTIGEGSKFTLSTDDKGSSIFIAPMDGGGKHREIDKKLFEEAIAKLEDDWCIPKGEYEAGYYEDSTGAFRYGLVYKGTDKPVNELTVHEPGYYKETPPEQPPVTPKPPVVTPDPPDEPDPPVEPDPPDEPDPPTPPAPSSGSGSSGSSIATYPITIKHSENGSVSAGRSRASKGTVITLNILPRGGELLSLTVSDGQGRDIPLTRLDGRHYTFTMPAGAVTVTPVFTGDPPANSGGSGGETDCPSRAFADLDTNAWYHEATDFVLRSGWMGGYENGLFRPDSPISRAQFTQILYNKEGRPAVSGGSAFFDVPDGSWCAGAVRWAAENGIVSGYRDGSFRPNSSITREQFAVMLWRYAGSPAVAENELHFADASSASGYALEALRWAVSQGVLNGKSGNILDPQGPATRAQAAQMLLNFHTAMNQ